MEKRSPVRRRVPFSEPGLSIVSLFIPQSPKDIIDTFTGGVPTGIKVVIFFDEFDILYRVGAEDHTSRCFVTSESSTVIEWVNQRESANEVGCKRCHSPKSAT